MSSLINTIYDLKDLRIVMVNKDYLVQKKEDYINYFNENVMFIAEKFVIEETDKDNKKHYSEYYTECITEEVLSERTSDHEFTDFPKIFSIVSRIPNKYLTEEEIKTGKISALRIYKLLQDINISEKNKVKRKEKIKKIGV